MAMVISLLCRIQYTCKPKHIHSSEHFDFTTSNNNQLPAISLVPPFCTWRSNSRPSFRAVPVVIRIIMGVAELPRLGCDNRSIESGCSPKRSTSTFTFSRGLRPTLEAAWMPLPAWYKACTFASVSSRDVFPASNTMSHVLKCFKVRHYNFT